MMKRDVHSPEKALAYIADCTLATVQSMAMKKSRPKGEYSRQKSIAQQAIDWMRDMNVDMSGTRAQDVFESTQGCVDLWAANYEV